MMRSPSVRLLPFSNETLLKLSKFLQTFEWKSQQQLGLVLDRLSLHKSRLESDLLRR